MYPPKLKFKLTFRKHTKSYALLALIATALSWVPINTNVAQATVPKYVNFQGKLTKVSDGTNVTNGSYAFEFKLYDASTSGTLLWTETYDQPSGACTKLVVTSGVFNAKLGSCASLSGIDFTGGSTYLSVNFAPTGTSYDGEMSPRKQLVSSPFAFVANSLNGDGNIDLADFDVDADGKTIIAPDTAGDALTVSNSATADIQGLVISSSNSTQTAGTIQVTSNTITDTAVLGMALTGTVQDAAGALTVYGNKTTLTVDTDAGSSHTAYGQHITIANNDASSTAYGLYVDAGTGAGTEYAAAFMNGRVGIGITAPTTALHVYEASGSVVGVFESNDSNNALFKLRNVNTNDSDGMQIGARSTEFRFDNRQTNGSITFYTDNGSTEAERARISGAGNLGIGDSTPAAALTVGNGDLFQVNSSGAIAAATGITSSGTINFSTLSASSTVYTDGSKNLTSTAPTSGTIGYWSRSGTTLQPATANDIISISGNSGDITTITSSATGSDNKALNVSQTGATVGTDYAGYFSNTGAATTNVGLYTTATGATNNYAAIFESGNVGIGTTTPTSKVHITAGTLSGSSKALYSTATLPTSGDVQAVRFEATSSGTGVAQTAMQTILNAGYSGSSITVASEILNVAASTGNDLKVANSITNVFGNAGINAFTYGVTTGLNIAGKYEVANGGLNIGVYSKAATLKNAATNIGVLGIGRNTGTTPTQIGGWFSLTNATPTWESAALVGDNSDQTSPIFLAKDNGTTVFSIIDGGNVGIGDTSPAAALTVGNGDLFQVNSSGAIAAVVGITNTGAQSTTVQSATALTVARTGSNYALQVDTNTASSATGVKITAAAAASGVAIAAISSGTDENLTLDGKGAGTISINGSATGNILFGGGSGSTGCTVTNSTGAFACTAGGSFTTLALTGAVTGAASYNGLVVTANTGVITTGTWNGTALTDTYVSDTLTSSLFVGSGSTTTAIDLATAEVAGILGAANGGTSNGFTAFTGPTTSTKTFTLPNASATILTDNALVTVAQGGTGANTFTSNGVLYGNGSSAIGVTAAGTTGQCLVGNTSSAPSWSSCSGTVTLQNAYDNSSSPATITTASGKNIQFTQAANSSFVIDASSTPTTQTNGVIDLNVSSLTTGASAMDISLTGTGSTASATQNGLNLTIVPSNATNARTYNGIKITNPDAGSVANTVTGINVDVTTANSSDTTYAALFNGGNVGIDNTTPGEKLDVTGNINVRGTLKIRNGSNTGNLNILDAGGGVATIDNTGNSILAINGGSTSTNFVTGNVGIGISNVTTPNAALQIATNGAASTPGVRLDGTWYAAGTSTTNKPQLLVEPTGTTSTTWSGAGTGIGANAASGFTGNLLDLQTNNASKFSVASDGTVITASTIFGGNDIYAGSSSYLAFSSRSKISSPADSNLLLTNAAANAFNLLQFGGTSSSFPALKRSTTTLQARLADDSGYTNLDAGNYLLSGTNINTAGTLTNVAYLNQANTFSANQTLTKADPSIVLDVTTATDTDFWFGVQDDAGNDDDDLFQIGKGTSPGSSPFLTINTSGNIGVGTTNPTLGRLDVRNTTASLPAILGWTTATSGNNYGGDFETTGTGATQNVGVYAVGANATTNYGGQFYGSGTGTTNIGLYASAAGATNNYAAIFSGGNVGIGDTSPAALLTVGSGDLFQVNSSGAIAAVVGITNTGAQSTTVQSATALTVARTGSNYALQVDTNTASSATGVKITAAAAASGVAIAAISSGTDENLTLDGKGAGTISINGSATGNILFGGGSGSTGCTVTNSTGAFACTAAITGSNLSGTNTGDQTITLTGEVTGSGTGSFATTITSQTSATWAGKVSDETGSGAWVFATSPTLTTPRIADLGYIADANGNEQVILDTVTSAVNEITIANAATGTGPTIAATGGDAAVALSINAKGTGTLNLGGTSTGDILLGGGSGSTGCTVTNSTGAFACTAGGSFTTLALTGAITGATGITSSGTINFSTLSASSAVYTDGSKNLTSTAPTSGAIGYWSRSGTTLQPATSNDVVAISSNAVAAGGVLDVTSSGTVTSGNNAIRVTANSVTTGVGISVSTTGVTTGTALNITGPSTTGVTTGLSSGFIKAASDVGSGGTGGVLAYLAPDYSSASAATSYGLEINGTDSTTVSNNNYNLYSNLAMSGNATSKLGVAIYGNVSSSSTLADTTYGGLFGTTASGAISTGSRSSFGIYSQPNVSSANTGGTTNVYGAFLAPASSNSTTGSTVNVYGSYATNQALLTTGGTINSYGNYIANGSMNTTGTSTQYGLYVENQTGADNNYAAVFAGGNVGIGTTTPTAFLHVGSNGAASNPGLKLSGSWFTGGDSTTTKPQALIEASGATSTGWSTSGTGLGINAPSGFAGRMIDVKLNGTTAFSLNEAGGISTIGQGITNFSATSGYWYQPAATVSVGNNGDSGASNLLLRAGVSGSSGGNITFNVNNSNTGIWNSAGLGIGTGTPIDPLSISTPINASATHALFNLSNTALSSGSGNGTYIGANPASFTGNFFDFQVANTSVAKLTSGGALTVTSCTGCGSSTRLDQVAAANTTATIANANNAIAWNWGSLTTQTGMTFGGGTAMTTGGVFTIGNGTYNHANGETGSIAKILVTDGTTTAGAVTSTTNGLNVATTIAATTSTSGTKTVNAINIASPTLTSCTGGASCVWNGVQITAPATTASFTTTGLKIVADSLTTTNDSGMSISAATLTSGNALKITAGGSTSLTSGAGLLVTGPTGAAAISNGLIQATATGNYTGTGGLLNVLATASTAGTLVNFTNNTASFTGTGINVSTTGITSGSAMQITGGGSMAAGGQLLGLTMGTAGAGNALNITANGGTYTGSGLQTFNSNSLTSGTMLSLAANGASQTTAKYIDIAQTGTTTGFTGSLINLSSSSTTGAATFINLAANSSTVGTGAAISMTGLTTGSALTITGPSSTGVTGSGILKVTSDVGSGGSQGMLAAFNPDYSSASAASGYGVAIQGTDSTSAANTNNNLYSNLALTGNAAKTGFASYNNVSSNSTTADTTYGGLFSTNITGAISTGTRNTYGFLAQPATSGANTGGTTQVFGGYFAPNSTGSTTGSTVNVFGNYISNTATLTTAGTINNYGLYVANGTSNTTGTSTKYGIFLQNPTGADTNYAMEVENVMRLFDNGAESTISATNGQALILSGNGSADALVLAANYGSSGTIRLDDSGGYPSMEFRLSGSGLNGTMGVSSTSDNFYIQPSSGRFSVLQTDAANAEALYINTEESTATQKVFTIETDFSSDNTGKFAVLADGSVGVGTDSPNSLAQLDVVRNQNTYTLLRVYNANSGSSASARLTLGNDTAAFNGQIIQSSSTETSFGGANSLNIYNSANAPIAFFTNGTNERMRIAGGGTVSIGTTATSGLLTLAQGDINDEVIYINTEEATTTQQVFAIESDTSTADTVKMYITAEGEIKAKLNSQVDAMCETSGIIGSCTSDGRLKTNVIDLEDGTLDKIMQIKPRYFDWLNGGGEHQPGFIAQEVQAILPATFHGYTGDGYLKFSKDVIIPYLTKALQELNQVSIKTNTDGTINRDSFVFEMPEAQANTAQITGTGTQAVASTGFVINQKGSGNIIQLQQGGIDKLLIANDGSLHISTHLASGFVMEVKNADTTLLTINTKGTAVLTGTLVVKKDIAVLGTVLGSTSVIAKNTSNSPIHQGDVVYLTGAADAVFGEQPTITVAAATESEKDKVIVGIADRNLSDFNLDESAPVSTDPTTINPGEYLNVVITGSFKKAAATSSSSNIAIGDKLTLSSTAGKLRKLNLNENAPVIGVALDALSTNVGSVRILLLSSTTNTIIQNIVAAPTPTPPPVTDNMPPAEDTPPPTEDTPPTPDPTLGDASPPAPLP